MADDEELSTEPARVEAWRLDQLIRAGYPVPIADRIAARLDIDLHTATDLLEDGCDLLVATDILL